MKTLILIALLASPLAIAQKSNDAYSVAYATAFEAALKTKIDCITKRGSVTESQRGSNHGCRDAKNAVINKKRNSLKSKMRAKFQKIIKG